MKSTSVENVKELRGDGLRVNMDINDLNLKVSGDGCRVTVARNCGSIRMVGDGCSLKVNCNDGKIEYTGDGGSIFLGGGSRTESVSYVGDGGRINVRAVKIQSKKEKSLKKSQPLTKPRCSLSDSELEIKIENETNEIKEAAKLGKKSSSSTDDSESEKIRKNRNLQRSKTIVVTKISNGQTPLNFNNNRFVQNWFRNPSSVIKTFGSSASGPESL